MNIELRWEDIKVGNLVCSDVADGTVVKITETAIRIQWLDDAAQNYSKDEFLEYGFTAYTKI